MAEVDEDGNVTAIAVGETVITVTTNDGSYTDERTIRVRFDVLSAIPDPAFQAYAQHRMDDADGIYPKWDTDEDGIFSLEEAAAVTRINLNYGYLIDKKRVYVKSLEGLEYFTGLLDLYCTDNELTEIDVTNNTELVRIEAYNNKLTGIDLSNNTKLTHLYVQGNKITSLDLTKAPDFIYLNCSNNLLTELDVTQNPELTNLRFSGNQLTDIDVSKNTKLTHLYMGNNQFTGIDISKNETLFHLYCEDNKITSLDVRNNTRINHLLCQNNELSHLTISRNGSLTDLRCCGNHLYQLDATVMDNVNLFTLYCGAQTTQDGTQRIINVELQRKQEARWVQYFKDDELNKNVFMKFVD
ncbi:MAG: leucine-rich repeat domain-containing protein [Tannerellaceae bacterium]|nr:leucine-rich repeat domain-containing protein [Tannerellaceae bacterium]